MLNAVNRIGGAVAIMKNQRQPLHMVQQPGAEIPHQLLSSVGLQPPRSEALQVHQHRHAEQHNHRQLQRITVRVR